MDEKDNNNLKNKTEHNNTANVTNGHGNSSLKENAEFGEMKGKLDKYEERIHDLEEVVEGMKKEHLELIYLYEDIQDRLCDIDR